MAEVEYECRTGAAHKIFRYFMLNRTIEAKQMYCYHLNIAQIGSNERVEEKTVS